MVFASVHCVRIWKQYQLGVRVHGYVGFNDVFVISDKASHGFHFRFRLWVGSAVCLLTFVGRSSFPCNKKVQCYSLPSPLLYFCLSNERAEYDANTQEILDSAMLWKELSCL